MTHTQEQNANGTVTVHLTLSAAETKEQAAFDQELFDDVLDGFESSREEGDPSLNAGWLAAGAVRDGVVAALSSPEPELESNEDRAFRRQSRDRLWSNSFREIVAGVLREEASETPNDSPDHAAFCRVADLLS